MPNFTFEDYKNAIRAKYEDEKNGDYSNYLHSPTSANLRNLCVKRFQVNNSKEDFITFQSFFDFPFDKDKKNLFGYDELNKLEAVKRFFLGKTENPAEDTIQIAAILVDLKPRPFKEFKKQLDPEELKLVNKLRGNEVSEVEVSPNEEIEKKEPENFINPIASFHTEEPTPIQNQKLTIKQTPTSIQTIVDIEEKPKQSKSIFDRFKYIAITVFLFVICIMAYFILTKKQCMQWTGDHYEIVDCDSKVQGSMTANPVQVLDEKLVHLKKIKVCDTTTFFRNEKAVVFYAKFRDSIECFNQIAPHPERSTQYLKPITQHMIDRYVNPCK